MRRQLTTGVLDPRYCYNMVEDIYIDLHYSGLSLGEGLQILEFSESEAYLHHPSPMPVGSELVMRSKSGLDFALHVARVHEKVTGSERVPGMVVNPVNLQGETLEWWDERVANTPEPVSESPAESSDLPEAESEAVAEPNTDLPETEAAEPKTDLPEAEAAAEPSDDSDEPTEVNQIPTEEVAQPNSRDTIVMDAVSPDAAIVEQPSSEEPPTSERSSDTIVMDAIASPDVMSPQASETEASSDSEDDSQPAGKKNKKKRRSRRKKR